MPDPRGILYLFVMMFLSWLMLVCKDVAMEGHIHFTVNMIQGSNAEPSGMILKTGSR